MFDAMLPFPASEQVMNGRTRVTIDIVNGIAVQGYISRNNGQYEMFPNVTPVASFFGMIVAFNVRVAHDLKGYFVCRTRYRSSGIPPH